MVTFNVISRDLLSWYKAKIVANSLPGWSFGQLGKAMTSKNIFKKKAPCVLPRSSIYLLCYICKDLLMPSMKLSTYLVSIAANTPPFHWSLGQNIQVAQSFYITCRCVFQWNRK